MVEDEDVCRVCRSEGTEDQPLYHPCKCSGSIRFVHQDCLTEWLRHSKKKYCEVCKYPFSFTPIYDPKMPDTIPIVLFLRRGIRRLYGLVQIWFRALLVGIVWLIALPWATVWIWRFYFWSGESIAFIINGQKVPNRISENNIESSEKSGLSIIYLGLLKGFIWYVPPDAVKFVEYYGDLASKVLSDTFEGQIITCVVVIVFVAAFLLREWIVQNTPAANDNNNINDQVNDGPANEGNVNNNGIMFPVEQMPEEPQVPAVANVANFNGGAFIFQNGHRLPLIQQEPHPPADQVLQQDPVPEPLQQNILGDNVEFNEFNDQHQEENINQQLIADNINTQNESNIMSSENRLGVKLANEDITYEKDDSSLPSEKNVNMDNQKLSMYVPYVDDSKMSIQALISDANREDSKGKNIESNDTVVFPELGDSSSQISQNAVSKDSSPSQFKIENSVIDKDDGFSSSASSSSSGVAGVAIQQGQSSDKLIPTLIGDRRIRPIRKVRTRMGDPVSSSNTIGQSTQNDLDDLSLGGSFTNVDYSEVSSKKEQLGDNNADYDVTPPEVSDSDEESEDINLQEKYPRGINDTYSPSKIIANTVYFAEDSTAHRNSNTNLQGYNDNFGKNDDDDDSSDFDEIDIDEDEGEQYVDDDDDDEGEENDSDDNDNPLEDDENEEDPAEELNVREPNAEVADAPVLPMPAPLFNEAIEPPAVDQGFIEADDEDEENVANEDLEGVLEAIGMRGSLWMLAQNSALMIVLIALCLAGSIWLPFIVGKTVLLIKPLNVIQLPLKLLRKVTDPLVDLVLDTGIPWLWSLVSPLLKSGWNATSPQISPMFEGSILMHYMQDVSDKTEDLLGYAAAIVAKIDPPESEIIAISTISSVNNFSEFLKAQNLTWLVKIIDRWNGFAYGNTPTDKIVCILCGYTVIIFLCAYYLAKTRNAYGATVGRAVQEGLRQQGIVLKVAFFVAIELVIFPIICGILLDLSTLPLFAEATPSSRLEFYLESPITSTFLHWFTEILDRPVWTQLKKIGASGIMYSAMIVFGLGSVIYFIRYCFDGILPLQLPFMEPISDFPADLLVFHIVVPVTVTWAKPKRLFRKLFENWWKVTSRVLRLTSFMFGGRHYDEEVIVDENAEVLFKKDGELVRAPSYDGITVVPGRRMLIPVNEDGTLKNPGEVPAGQDDQLNYTVVYIPPNFRARVIIFLFLMWFCGSLFCCSVTVLPLLTGRYIFKSILHHQRAVHDLYTFTVGLYVLWAHYVAIEWITNKIQAIAERQDRNIDWAMVRQKMLQGIIVVVKILYLVLFFGMVIPFLLSLVIELYVILPWKKPTTDIPVISFLQDWALGIVYMKIAYRIVFMLPDNIYSRAINEITGRGIKHLNVQLATTVFIFPIGGSALAAVILPALTAWVIISTFGITNANSIALIIRYIYPVFLALILGYRVQRQMGQLVDSWMQAVRDEEYLIGRRLHNIEPNEQRGNTNNDIIRAQ
ncbi:RING finger membrane protein [Rhizophagus clarus]|uniref:RING-type E3 ubiquitin transferase n=1 Tax=Rhizophagus clarus TaxID=94130 RepID=A0A8H3M9Y3_9GLOM|nr:RING finger membrane protein [Rhizophagus clarus]